MLDFSLSQEQMELQSMKALVIYEGTREIHTIMQAEYALGYRKDKPLNRMLPAWNPNDAGW
jgi:glutaryl-CoA dehydrogenase (non-decarboxylating)